MGRKRWRRNKNQRKEEALSGKPLSSTFTLSFRYIINSFIPHRPPGRKLPSTSISVQEMRRGGDRGPARWPGTRGAAGMQAPPV